MSVQVAVDWKRTHFHRCISAIKCSPKLGQINCKIIIAPGWRAAAKKMQRHFALLSSTVFLSLTKTVSLGYLTYLSWVFLFWCAVFLSLIYYIFLSLAKFIWPLPLAPGLQKKPRMRKEMGWAKIALTPAGEKKHNTVSWFPFSLSPYIVVLCTTYKCKCHTCIAT